MEVLHVDILWNSSDFLELEVSWVQFFRIEQMTDDLKCLLNVLSIHCHWMNYLLNCHQFHFQMTLYKEQSYLLMVPSLDADAAHVFGLPICESDTSLIQEFPDLFESRTEILLPQFCIPCKKKEEEEEEMEEEEEEEEEEEDSIKALFCGAVPVS